MKKNNKILDLFCGAGGLSLGFERAGFTVVKAIDIDPHAVNTYNHNRKATVAEVLDITKIDDAFISSLGEMVLLAALLVRGLALQVKESLTTIETSCIVSISEY